MSARGFLHRCAPLLAEWRQRQNLDPEPMQAYRASGYEAKVAGEREASRAARVQSSGSYA